MTIMDNPVFTAIKRVNKDKRVVGLKFYCWQCRKWHVHGFGDGHRVAHCVRGSAWKKAGYELVKHECSAASCKNANFHEAVQFVEAMA